jgi:hypothetical protein
MHILQDIIDQARQLPRHDQRQLLKELEELLDQGNAVEEPLIPNKLYSKSLELAGAFHMVDSNKRGQSK